MWTANWTARKKTRSDLQIPRPSVTMGKANEPDRNPSWRPIGATLPAREKLVGAANSSQVPTAVCKGYAGGNPASTGFPNSPS